jgi:hypothetical protein
VNALGGNSINVLFSSLNTIIRAWTTIVLVG